MTKYIDLPKINPVTHAEHPDLPRNKWCGPAAISIITGMPAELAAEWIRIRRGQSGTTKGIMGTMEGEVLSALTAAGCRVLNEYYTKDEARRIASQKLSFEEKQAVRRSRKRVTLTQWMRARDRKATYLLVAGNHYIVVRGNKACCGKTQDVVSVKKIPGRRSLVKSVWRIQKPSRYKFKDLLPKRYEKVWNERKGHWQLIPV